MSALVGWSVVSVSLCVCGCPRCKRKTTGAISTYTVTHDLGMRWPWSEKVKGQGHVVMRMRCQRRCASRYGCLDIFILEEKSRFLTTFIHLRFWDRIACIQCIDVVCCFRCCTDSVACLHVGVLGTSVQKRLNRSWCCLGFRLVWAPDSTFTRLFS